MTRQGSALSLERCQREPGNPRHHIIGASRSCSTPRRRQSSHWRHEAVSAADVDCTGMADENCTPLQSWRQVVLSFCPATSLRSAFGGQTRSRCWQQGEAQDEPSIRSAASALFLKSRSWPAQCLLGAISDRASWHSPRPPRLAFRPDPCQTTSAASPGDAGTPNCRPQSPTTSSHPSRVRTTRTFYW